MKPINTLCKVTHTENLDLIESITEEKIQHAIVQMNPYKALGVDGSGASFFQKYWTLLKDHMCLAVQDFFHSDKTLKEFNHISIALIPKVDNPETSSQFRPISLCNTFYKVIAKILVNRMRPFLKWLIQLTHSAFVPHRAIHDNIFLAHEVINKFHHLKGKRGYVALELYMEKAYDRIE